MSPALTAAEAAHATIDREINVSPHLLADVDGCSTWGYVRHVRGYTSAGDSIKMVAGQGIHRSMEVLFDPTDPRPPIQRTAAMLAAFHTVYDEKFAACPPEKLDSGYTPQNLDNILRRWVELRVPQIPWARVLSTEEAFCSRSWTFPKIAADGAPIFVKVNLILRPDLVVEDAMGYIRWVDSKSTGWRIMDPGWQAALKLSSQVQLYSDGVVQKYGDKAVFGGWISAMEIRTLPGQSALKMKKDGTPAKERTCQDHGRPYSECGLEHVKAEFIECLTTPMRVQQAVIDAERAASKFVDIVLAQEKTATQENPSLLGLGMQGTAKNLCRFCPAATWCLEGERTIRPNGLESFFVYDPWRVETGRRI